MPVCVRLFAIKDAVSRRFRQQVAKRWAVYRKNTLPARVHVPRNMKWPGFGNIFRVACGIILAKASAAAAGGDLGG